MTTESVFYSHSGKVPFASRLSVRARRAMFQRFMDVMQPGADTAILDIGVTCDARFPESNFFERWYPHKQRITAVGTEDGSHLEQLYPGLKFLKVAPGRPLPFDDRHFDIVFSNAVIEHTGGLADQRQFLKEALRVSRRFFVTTPNRWFPVEAHTGLPLLHFLPPRRFRQILRDTRFDYWAHEANLNLLSAQSLFALFDRTVDVRVESSGIGLGPMRSNLIAWGEERSSAA